MYLLFTFFSYSNFTLFQEVIFLPVLSTLYVIIVLLWSCEQMVKNYFLIKIIPTSYISTKSIGCNKSYNMKIELCETEHKLH